MATLKLDHSFKNDIQAALLSSCKERFLNYSVNFMCKDGVVSCDRTVLILVSKNWQNIFLSSNSDTDIVLTPDYSVYFIKNYIHSCIKDNDEENNFDTSEADGTNILENNMRDQREGVGLEKNLEDDYSAKDDDADCLEKNLRGQEEGVCLKKSIEDNVDDLEKCTTGLENRKVDCIELKAKDNIANQSKHLISSLLDEYVKLLCEVCVENEGLEMDDSNIIYFDVSSQEAKKIKINYPDDYIKNTKIRRTTKKIMLKFNPYFETFEVKESTSCNICLKKFSKPAHCRMHMKHAHSEENKFKCDKCERKFKSEKGLHTHLKTSHENESKNPFICSTCGHVFLEKRSLIRHCNTNCTVTKSSSGPKVKNQSDKLPRGYKCTKCNYKTTRNDNLLRHEREVHRIFDMELEAVKNTFDNEEKSSYKCPNCQKTLITSEEVQKNIVNKVCLLTCNVCGKTFTRNDNLKRHQIKIHKIEVGVSLEKKD